MQQTGFEYAAIEFIFVYGTLRQKTGTPMAQVLARHCAHFANGYLQGKLYEVNGYPGAIESASPEDKVYGELYRIAGSELVLSLLDAYEECTDKHPKPHEYLRKPGLISLFDGGGVTAWSYIFNHDTSMLTPIVSGDYLNWTCGTSND